MTHLITAGGDIVVCRADGTVVRRIAHPGYSVQGISDDGRRVVLGRSSGQTRTGYELFDMVSGKNLDLPYGVRPPDPASAEIHPMPGDELLVRVNEGTRNRIYLLAADNTILDTRAEPTALHQALLFVRTAG